MTAGAGRSPGTSPSASDRARSMTAEALEELTEQLNSGKSDRLTAYLKAMGRFHAYSFGNVMLIASQRPDATRVAGFKAWKSLGRSVKKGEQGIVIVAPMVLKGKQDADPNGIPGDEDKPRVRFRGVHVFDISQTEGDELPEPARFGGDPGGALQRLEAAVVDSGITLNTAEHLAGADGISKGGEIVLCGSLEPAERFATLVHEWAHEMLHHGSKDERPSKTVRETEAEAVAFVVGHAIGLEASTASSDYIALYRGDAETLMASMDRVQKTACRIIEAIRDDKGKAVTIITSHHASHAASRQR